MRNIVGASALLLVTIASPAFAATIAFENSFSNVGGTVAIDQTGVTISNGRIDKGGLLATPGFNITGACGGFGCLTIDTGNFLSQEPGTQTYNYSTTGATISIVGTAVGTGATGTLYSGTFDLNTVITLTRDVVGGVVQPTATLQGTLDGGSLNPTLASFLGVPSTTLTGVVNNLVFNLVVTPGVANFVVGSGNSGRNDVRVDTASVVPEPGSMVLLGTGMMFGATRLRKFFRR